MAHDLAPAETAGLDPDRVLAIITEAGGALSHTAVLAAQLGIPAVVQLSAAVDLADGTPSRSTEPPVWWSSTPTRPTAPSWPTATSVAPRPWPPATGPGRTSDGQPVALMVNIGTVQDAVAAAAQDVEGVGLFRTELLFLATDTAADAAGADRDLHPGVRAVRAAAAWSSAPSTPGPTSRWRSPTSAPRPTRPSAGAGCACRPCAPTCSTPSSPRWPGPRGPPAPTSGVMAPMVATAEEAAWFARRVRENGLPSVGVMIEVPAAALRARHVLAEVDFGSIGTNDLAQYTLAADRDRASSPTLLDPWQPAVLDLIATACEGARAAGRPIGVCGEAAGDPLLALVLTGLGAMSLSMAPPKVPAVRLRPVAARPGHLHPHGAGSRVRPSRPSRAGRRSPRSPTPTCWRCSA